MSRIQVSPQAAAQIRVAASWWRANRPKAPLAFAEELEKGFDLVRVWPERSRITRDACSRVSTGVNGFDPTGDSPPQPARTGSSGQQWIHTWGLVVAVASLAVAVIGVVIAYQAWKRPAQVSAEVTPQRSPGASGTELNEEEAPESPPQAPVDPVEPPPPPSGSGAARASTPDIGDQVTTAESTGNPGPAGSREGATVIARTDGQEVEAATEPPPLRSPRRLGDILGAPPPSAVEDTEDPPVVPPAASEDEREPQDQPLDPQVTSGEMISVVTKPFVEPKGPRPLREPRLPPVPRKDMKSGLIGGVMVCQVAVSAAGEPGAECGRTGGPSGFDEYLRREAKQMLEALPWAPATNTEGEPCAGIVEVRFMWQ